MELRGESGGTRQLHVCIRPACEEVSHLHLTLGKDGEWQLTNIVVAVRAKASVVVVDGKLLAIAGSRSMWARTGLVVAYQEPHPH